MSNPGPMPPTASASTTSPLPPEAQHFGAEIKGNPTESEADVAADRSDLDPLPDYVRRQMKKAMREGGGEAGFPPAAPTPTPEEFGSTTSWESADQWFGEGVVKGNPTTSEADVAADRSGVDPLRRK